MSEVEHWRLGDPARRRPPPLRRARRAEGRRWPRRSGQGSGPTHPRYGDGHFELDRSVSERAAAAALCATAAQALASTTGTDDQSEQVTQTSAVRSACRTCPGLVVLAHGHGESERLPHQSPHQRVAGSVVQDEPRDLDARRDTYANGSMRGNPDPAMVDVARLRVQRDIAAATDDRHR